MYSIKKIRNLLYFFALGTLFTSCLNSMDSTDYQQMEDQKITDYISRNYPTVTPTSSGLYYISETEGTGDSPSDDDFVIIRYKGWTLDGLLFDSTDSTDQSTVPYPWFRLFGPLKYSMKVNFPGLNETLKKMKPGGKAIAIMPSILAYQDYVPRKFEIQLVQVIHNIAAYERQLINNYVTARGASLADSTASGIYFFQTQAGSGAYPVNNQYLSIQYKGMLVDGRVFDKTSVGSDYSFTLGVTELISGFDEAVRKMQKGGKATVVIPYYRAYGANRNPSLGQIAIPWYSTLVFDIQLNNIQ